MVFSTNFYGSQTPRFERSVLGSCGRISGGSGRGGFGLQVSPRKMILRAAKEAPKILSFESLLTALNAPNDGDFWAIYSSRWSRSSDKTFEHGPGYPEITCG